MTTVLLTAGCGLPGSPGTLPPATEQQGAAVTFDQGGRILNRVAQTPQALPERGYTSAALRAIQARLTLAAAKVSTPSERLPSLSGQPELLAASRGGAFPRYLIGRTSPADGQPVLHLLVCDNVRSPYRVVLSASTMAGADLGPLPAFPDGLATAADGAGMVAPPQDLFAAYAAVLSGQRGGAFFTDDEYQERFRRDLAELGSDTEDTATVTSSHAADASSVVALRQSQESTLVFGVIDRHTQFKVRPGAQLTQSAEFTVLSGGRSTVVQQADVNTLVFLVFAVPASGQARLVAAAEQVVASSGY